MNTIISKAKSLASIFKTKEFLLFLIISLVVRFANFDTAIYFTWDNGRDYFAIKEILAGDITLIGPTTGLHGFYLGPLWFYLGIPGMIFGNGNPYLFLLWYIVATLTCLPLFWYLSKLLFKDKTQFKVAAYGLSLIPGSVWGSMRVWNPMISLPLVTLILIGLFKIRESRWYIALCFLSLGLLLQSEFAYAIFYIGIFFVLLGSWRGKYNWLDYVVASVSFGITLLPQLLFELRHDFIMSKALITALSAEGSQAGLLYFLSRRLYDLFITNSTLLFGGLSIEKTIGFGVILGLLIGSGAILIDRFKQNTFFKFIQLKEVILSLLFLIPFVMFLFWRGNNDAFYSYYFTPHFIFMVPLLMIIWKEFIGRKFSPVVSSFFVGTLIVAPLVFIQNVFVLPVNDAGGEVIDTAVIRVADWMEQDGQNPGTLRVYTSNAETEHYDAFIHYNFKTRNMPIPSTVRTPEDQIWYIIREPDSSITRFNKWYIPEINNAKLIRQEKIGVLILETWAQKTEAELLEEATASARLVPLPIIQ